VSVLAALVCLLEPALASAGDGVIEINQVRALAGGINGSLASDPPGFPIVLTQPGSYRLTSDLVVPAKMTGIRLETAGARIDLNGFAITGPFVCSPGTCFPLSGSGIDRPNLFTGERTTVRNGEISGFALDGASVGPLSHVEGVVFQHIGGDAILAPAGSLVIANRVSSVGKSGLAVVGAANTPTLARDNVFMTTGLGGTGAAAIEGPVRATGGNSCSDGSCSARGTRRFYQTKGSVSGAQTLTACAPGFHFASLWEIYDVSTLEYDERLGYSHPGAGRGPSSVAEAWVRTGFSQVWLGDDRFEPNCNSWSSDSPDEFGAAVKLETDWREGTVQSPIAPWRPYRMNCVKSFRVWCVED